MDTANAWRRHALRMVGLAALLAFLISAVVCILALRNNNTTMLGLRQDVYTVDKNNGDVNGALDKLRNYVYGHMNTNLATSTNIKPPIQLKYTYARLETAALQQAGGADIYAQATDHCEIEVAAGAPTDVISQLPCLTNYVLGHSGKKAATVPTGLYEFDFASPSWSPDLAGWSMVIAAASLLIAAVCLLFELIERSKLPPL